jgi:hypothetical protein
METWPFWLAGLGIGAFVPLFALATGKALGISSGYSEMCALTRPATSERWKLWFALGLPLGGLASALLGGGPTWVASSGDLTSALGLDGPAQLALLALGGGFIGYGARTAGGCTSGHSIVGIAQGAKSSLIATIGFMVGGFAATWGALLLAGGAA